MLFRSAFKRKIIPADRKTTMDYLVFRFATQMISRMLSDRLQEMLQQENPPFAFATVMDGSFYGVHANDALQLIGVARPKEAEITIATLLRETKRAHDFATRSRPCASSGPSYPGWVQMIEEQLRPLGNGLFTLQDTANLEREIPQLQGVPFSTPPLFLLSAEISSIYKKNGQVRKVHNLVYMPSLDMVKNFNTRLAQVGNLQSDGRPILGLDSKNLLEMVLETGPGAFLVPAHIWTPWFSLFGSKSGFDSLEECFEDLTPHIFALETGLSSDPEMNWLWSELDNLTLISNSDAHSGANLGREANVFSGQQDYTEIFASLHRKPGATKFQGTLEFFPEEDKYPL